ncbi:hypothetical protein F511_38380 [Dorcoceras hygrometricum]|uniref:Uncharacterized protein n=1 Tax=Dorcoceras hygrometricum TaxID=472368 RepID=A0A2Z7B727_9LAMI|nr:hypothetical protein F511_38380 [Dorcoceras hygrometricum]
MNEEVTRVSQYFGVLTIGFSSCASGGRSADGLRNQSQELLINMMTRDVMFAADCNCVVLLAADQQMRNTSVEKRRRLS